VYPHRIRLRGPWECQPPARPGEPPPPPRRVTMPCSWDEIGPGDVPGRVRFTRRFGYPGRIDDYERAWLTVAGAAEGLEISLNGHRLSPSAAEWDVTGLLRERNRVEVEVEPSGGGPWEEIALEVRCTAYLRGVRPAVEAGRLHVIGEVVGTAGRPLEVYALLDNATVAYAVAEAAPEGRAFHLVGESVVQPGAHQLRVDLVNGASVWYVFEQDVTVGAGG